MKLFKPLHACAFVLGLFPCVEDKKRFRLHWTGVVIKISFVVFFSLTAVRVYRTTVEICENFKKSRVNMFTSLVLTVEEFYPHMAIASMIVYTACHLQFFRPGVYRVINDCLFSTPIDITRCAQYLTAFTVVAYTFIEIVTCFLLILRRYLHILICIYESDPVKS